MEDIKLTYKVVRNKKKSYTVLISANYFSTKEDAIEFIESCAFETDDFVYQRLH
jgi:hypothetical protein